MTTDIARTRAAVIGGPGVLSIEDLEIPPPARGEALVRIEYCGICGTDLHAVLEGWAPVGTVPGHEWSGTVVAVGPGVDAVTTGDLVVGGPSTCGECEWCTSGHRSLCVTDPLRHGDYPHRGAFAELHLARAAALHRVPPGMPARTAALAEPLAVALHGLTLADLPPEPSAIRVLVTGGGPLGLLVVAALAARGVGHIVVSEPAEGRRRQALAVGATAAVAPDGLPAAPAMPTECLPDGFDVCVETSGRAEAISGGLDLLRPTGRLVLLGTSAMAVTLNPLRILLNELVVTGGYCYDDDGIAAALDLLATGTLPIERLAAREDTGLDDLLQTMKRLSSGELSTKALVRP
ncbi:MAG: alcohol dehydrogenase catalytic domain-containing protein [Frankiaceae bacterium]|nr:alcohol dehydrogenase catalytic domain-containing protein [Frankiaceae bacterium]